jgi:hypothetical protein
MKEPRPFLEDGSQFGVSRTGFRRMRKAEKLGMMVDWFHQNFEDPAEKHTVRKRRGRIHMDLGRSVRSPR